MTASADKELGPIVSSAHLAAGAMPTLSELEFGVILLGHAFERWMVRCMAAAGVPDLSPLDVLVLHSVAHRERPKRLADICLVLSIEDTHLVNYSVKKLEGLEAPGVGPARQREDRLFDQKGRDNGRKLPQNPRGSAGQAVPGGGRRAAHPVRDGGADAGVIRSLRSGRAGGGVVIEAAGEGA